ncbi:hypothetical protein H257_02901 [Aphanomyces astaci]|uniref:Uncharacterized protein n=1 Tax=Aphanomyces astaci TaxID=112090 RepID=W4H1H7_APHAT|nr:hypothetical protein H257_02901 [Aphanomyces astaci]ETV85008.1 hypothetical protein H257_02901 [Aphanomyces astaci]|eukprot:XP_009825026.1 hypothetical protein H257_02901 [Aphanomyces astaci]
MLARASPGSCRYSLPDACSYRATSARSSMSASCTTAIPVSRTRVSMVVFAIVSSSGSSTSLGWSSRNGPMPASSSPRNQCNHRIQHVVGTKHHVGGVRRYIPVGHRKNRLTLRRPTVGSWVVSATSTSKHVAASTTSPPSRRRNASHARTATERVSWRLGAGTPSAGRSESKPKSWATNSISWTIACDMANAAASSDDVATLSRSGFRLAVGVSGL